MSTELIAALDRYLRQDETAGDTDNGVYRQGLAAMSAALSTQEGKPSDEEEEDDTANEWRRLALQFDGHRMQAMAHIRMCLKRLARNGVYEDLRRTLEEFNAAPPLSGESVLAERIAALAN